VVVADAPPLNVFYNEVGLKESENVRVGGATRSFWYQALVVVNRLDRSHPFGLAAGEAGLWAKRKPPGRRIVPIEASVVLAPDPLNVAKNIPSSCVPVKGYIRESVTKRFHAWPR
jgi:hypothetical protein